MNAASQGGAGGAGGDPTQGGDGGGAQPVAVVCIAAMSDGSFQVYQDDGQGGQDAGDPGQGGQGAGDGSGQGGVQSAADLDDALTAAGQMLEQVAGAGGDGSGGATGGGADDGSGADGNQTLSPSDAKAAWNQLAAQSDKKRALGM
jgi:hypothetical protein